MNIFEIHTRFDISMKKLRRMQKEGVLNCSDAPDYWQRAKSDVRKGSMSARSVALASKFPERLEAMIDLTLAERKVVKRHFGLAQLPAEKLPLERLSTPVCGAAHGETRWMTRFIEEVQALIPDRPVSYLYLAVRLLLTCDTDFQMNLMTDDLLKAFTNARKEPSMRDWWHREPSGEGDYTIVYNRPQIAHDL